MAKPVTEEYIVENISISDLLNKDFLELIKRTDENLMPISIVLLKEKLKQEGEEKHMHKEPIIISQQSNDEVKRKITHVNCQDSEMLDKFIKLLDNKTPK